MAEQFLLMSLTERNRLEVLSRLKRKEITLGEAATLMKISYRQAIRIHHRYLQEGDVGLVHKSRGQPSCRSKPPDFKQHVIQRYRERYQGFGPTLAAEKLVAEGYVIDHSTLWKWLIESGDWVKKDNRRAHRKRRKSWPHFGELLQLDGSEHEWFDQRREKCCLMNLVDDATGTTLAILREHESTESAMEVLWHWLNRYGIPHSVYVDRHAIYYPQNQKPTQFSRTCQELGIEVIYARSPQAKGRVEKNHSVYQNRLVKEMRLQGMSRLAEGNHLLENGFVDQLNEKFAVRPDSEVDFHRPVPPEMDLAKIFSLCFSRKIGNDWIVRWNNRHFQIADQAQLPAARTQVEVSEYLDKNIHIFHQGRELLQTEVGARAKHPKENLLSANTYEVKKAKYALMKRLRQGGHSIKAITAEVEMDKRTVKKYLHNGGIPKYKRGKVSKLKPFEEQIARWIEVGVRPIAMYNKLVALDYDGSYARLTDYIRKVKLQRQEPIRQKNAFKPYKERVKTWIQAGETSGKKIYQRLQQQGYSGSYEISQKYVRQVKQELGIAVQNPFTRDFRRGSKQTSSPEQ